MISPPDNLACFNARADHYALSNVDIERLHHAAHLLKRVREIVENSIPQHTPIAIGYSTVDPTATETHIMHYRHQSDMGGIEHFTMSRGDLLALDMNLTFTAGTMKLPILQWEGAASATASRAATLRFIDAVSAQINHALAPESAHDPHHGKRREQVEAIARYSACLLNDPITHVAMPSPWSPLAGLDANNQAQALPIDPAFSANLEALGSSVGIMGLKGRTGRHGYSAKNTIDLLISPINMPIPPLNTIERLRILGEPMPAPLNAVAGNIRDTRQ